MGICVDFRPVSLSLIVLGCLSIRTQHRMQNSLRNANNSGVVRFGSNCGLLYRGRILGITIPNTIDLDSRRR
jgi:hypothetical protein